MKPSQIEITVTLSGMLSPLTGRPNFLYFFFAMHDLFYTL